MSYVIKQPIFLVTTIIWLGFILSISFMEAWLKFRAPGVTIPIGLGIGRLIFFVLNKIEWILLIVLIVQLIGFKESFFNPQFILVVILAVILLLQTFWLLPKLDARAQLIIQGSSPPNSFLHLFYVAGEFLKVAALVVLIIIQFKKIT